MPAAHASRPKPLARLRWRLSTQTGNTATDSITDELPVLTSQPLVAVIDHAGAGRSADSELFKKLCQQLQTQNNSEIVANESSWLKVVVQNG